MNPKIYQSLGLAKRAGKIVVGETQVVQAIRQQKAKLIILATDTAATTRKKIIDKSTFYKVPYREYGTRGQIGKSIGNDENVVIALIDVNFANMISNLCIDDRGL